MLQVPLDKALMPGGNVEVWLAEVERRMIASVRQQIMEVGGCGSRVLQTELAPQWSQHYS